MRSYRWVWLFMVIILLGACTDETPTDADPAPTEVPPQPSPTEPTESDPAPPPTAAPETAAAADSITLRMYVGDVGDELALTETAVAAYMAANPNVSVELLPLPDAVEDRWAIYQEQLTAESTVDVYQIDVIWPGELDEHFVDLYDYGADAVVDQHFPAGIENNTVDGRLIAMPWFVDAGLLYYRTDLLEKYGYDAPPATWDELEEMAAAIQAGERTAGHDNFWGYLWQGADYEGLTCNALEWMVTQDAGAILDDEGRPSVANVSVQESLQQAKGWVGTISPSDTLAFREEDTRLIWETGSAAFMRNWPYVYGTSNSSDSAIKGLFNVSALPAVNSEQRAGVLGGWQLAVSQYSEYPAEAADLVFYLTSLEEQKRRAVEGSYNPTIMSLYDDADVLSANPFFGSLYDVFVNAVPRPSTAVSPHYTAFSSAFHHTVHDVLSNKRTADEALAQLEVELNALLIGN